ncbi:sensor histidine kinase [Cerasicoccus arenae]|uniref:histidine kinase n=1 Tax=Cerasicoccus arenae TaxID=424488 RepID=A0A8J3DC21_9BACT|nr:HAMP domain-containing sensor histidine kinase [Cerasicoccus arenae]MBK1859201.1 HAMP domain-containing histidine kinase [Cerasicoccus arenae]GHC01246.1 hypothetical protein GCM10007047_17110 [Cerasicoccus arenae]
MSGKIYQDQFTLLEQISCPVALVDENLTLHFANNAFEQRIGELPILGDLETILANPEAVMRSLQAASQISGLLPLRIESLRGSEALLGLISRVTFAGRPMFLIQGSQTDSNRYYKINREMEFVAHALSRERRIAQEHENTCHAIEAFIDVLVHDIRSPLATVVQGLGLLPDEVAAENREYSRVLMHEIKLSSERLVDFVDSLYAHSQVHRAKLVLESIDLSILLANLQVDLRSLLTECGGELTGPSLLPVVKADRQLLRQLLQNLLQNSVKFRHTERALKIQIGCDRLNDSHLELFVKDNGQGFDPSRLKNLFNPYVRTGQSNNDGLGIGLATCKSIADKHGWAIRAEGDPGKGATFRVKIPSWC